MANWNPEYPGGPPWYYSKLHLDGNDRIAWTTEIPYCQVGPGIVPDGSEFLYLPLADIISITELSDPVDRIKDLYVLKIKDATGDIVELTKLHIPTPPTGKAWHKELLHAPWPGFGGANPPRLRSWYDAPPFWGIHQWPSWADYWPMGDAYQSAYGKVDNGGWLAGMIWTRDSEGKLLLVPRWSQSPQLLAYGLDSAEPVWAKAGWEHYLPLAAGSYELFTVLEARNNGQLAVHVERYEWQVVEYERPDPLLAKRFSDFHTCRPTITHSDTATGDGTTRAFEISVNTEAESLFESNLEVLVNGHLVPFDSAYYQIVNGACPVCEEAEACYVNYDQCLATAVDRCKQGCLDAAFPCTQSCYSDWVDCLGIYCNPEDPYFEDCCDVYWPSEPGHTECVNTVASCMGTRNTCEAACDSTRTACEADCDLIVPEDDPVCVALLEDCDDLQLLCDACILTITGKRFVKFSDPLPAGAQLEIRFRKTPIDNVCPFGPSDAPDCCTAGQDDCWWRNLLDFCDSGEAKCPNHNWDSNEWRGLYDPCIDCTYSWVVDEFNPSGNCHSEPPSGSFCAGWEGSPVYSTFAYGRIAEQWGLVTDRFRDQLATVTLQTPTAWLQGLRVYTPAGAVYNEIWMEDRDDSGWRIQKREDWRVETARPSTDAFRTQIEYPSQVQTNIDDLDCSYFETLNSECLANCHETCVDALDPEGCELLCVANSGPSGYCYLAEWNECLAGTRYMDTFHPSWSNPATGEGESVHTNIHAWSRYWTSCHGFGGAFCVSTCYPCGCICDNMEYAGSCYDTADLTNGAGGPWDDFDPGEAVSHNASLAKIGEATTSVRTDIILWPGSGSPITITSGAPYGRLDGYQAFMVSKLAEISGQRMSKIPPFLWWNIASDDVNIFWAPGRQVPQHLKSANDFDFGISDNSPFAPGTYVRDIPDPGPLSDAFSGFIRGFNPGSSYGRPDDPDARKAYFAAVILNWNLTLGYQVHILQPLESDDPGVNLYRPTNPVVHHSGGFLFGIQCGQPTQLAANQLLPLALYHILPEGSIHEFLTWTGEDAWKTAARFTTGQDLMIDDSGRLVWMEYPTNIYVAGSFPNRGVLLRLETEPE